MATATLMSVEKFAALPEDGQMHELVEGELLTMPPPGFLHTNIVALIFGSISVFLSQNPIGRAFAEGGFLLTEDPPTVRQPDIAFVRADRIPQRWEGIYFRGAPDVAIEVVSPSDRAGDLELKVRQYLAVGAKAVAVVYPQTRSIWVHRPAGSPHLLGISENLEIPDVLPGWSVAVSEILAPVSED